MRTGFIFELVLILLVAGSIPAILNSIWGWLKVPLLIVVVLLAFYIVYKIISKGKRRKATNVVSTAQKQSQTQTRTRAKQQVIVSPRESKFTQISEARFLEEAKRSFVAFDFETTGFSAAADEIIEVGAIRYINGFRYKTFSELVKPSRPIPASATRIHGITNAMVKNARSIEQVLPDFLAFLGDDPLIAHNARFDIAFLKEAVARAGMTVHLRYHCSLTLSRRHYPELKSHKLGLVAEHIGCPIGQAHRSEDDCIAVCDIVVDVLRA